jgi:predicted amidohydrolase
MNISILQVNLAWEDREKNLEMFEEKLESLQHKTDLAVLPEMFTTGFSMNPEALSEEMNGPSFKWMKKTAANINAVLIGSLIIREGNNHYNRLISMFPNGDYSYYDKRHLFRMGEENKHYTAGREKKIITVNDCRILPLICYDLRFPVWSRNRGDYDMLIYIANWPEPRRHVWKNLLIARALENQVYVVGLNRIGEDGQGLSYSGDSMVIDPKGRIISNTEPYKESVETVEVSLKSLNEFRKKFPVGKDADDFEIKTS